VAERKIPISHLPDHADVSRSHFWDVMAGKKSPTLAWLDKIARALDADVADLVGRR
jgi:Cro/C1-type helix-turn-helix DNA-binding protein